jgi:flagellar basal-body rod protein FlgF
VKANNFQVDKAGRVWINAAYAGDPEDLVGREQNEWERTVLLDTLKIVDFENTRYLAKQGSSLWKDPSCPAPPESRGAGQADGAAGLYRGVQCEPHS